MCLLGIVWLPWNVARAQSQEAKRAQIRERLQAFVLPEDLEAVGRERLPELESDDYVERRAAMAFFFEAAGLKGFLEEALEDDPSPELAVALRVILAGQTQSGNEEKLRLLMRRIRTEKVGGLTDDLLTVWEGRAPSTQDSRRLSRSALLATLQPEDAARFREALKSETPMVRELAVLGVQQTVDRGEWPSLLLPLVEDESELVRFHVGVLLAAAGERASLPVLAGLLDSKQFFVRRQSHEVLTGITGQDFDYVPDRSEAQRKAATGLWRRWVAKFGETAEVRWGRAGKWLQAGSDVLE